MALLLQVGVVVVEGRHVELQRVLQEAVLRADFNGHHLFGLEGARRLQGLPRVEAARAEAVGHGHVHELVLVELVVQGHAAGALAEGGVAVGGAGGRVGTGEAVEAWACGAVKAVAHAGRTVGRHRGQRRGQGDQVAVGCTGRIQRQHRVGVGELEGLGVLRVARTRRQGHGRAELVVQLAIHRARVGLGHLVVIEAPAVLRQGDGRAERRRANGAGQLLVDESAAQLILEQVNAGHIAQRALGVAQDLEFLRHGLGCCGLVVQRNGGGREVGIRRARGDEIGVAGDGLERGTRDLIGQVQAHVAVAEVQEGAVVVVHHVGIAGLVDGNAQVHARANRTGASACTRPLGSHAIVDRITVAAARVDDGERRIEQLLARRRVQIGARHLVAKGRAAVATLCGAVHAEHGFEVLGGLEQQAATEVARVLIEHASCRVEVVLHPGVGLVLDGHQAQGSGVAQGQVEDAFCAHLAVVADQQAGGGFVGLELGGIGGDGHRTAKGVAAEQRALRAAHHFHAGDVHEAHHGLLGA